MKKLDLVILIAVFSLLTCGLLGIFGLAGLHISPLLGFIVAAFTSGLIVIFSKDIILRRWKEFLIASTLLASSILIPTAGTLDSQGPNNPGSVVDDSSVGDNTWSNTDYAKSSDDKYASVSGTMTSGYSHYLKATDFGFSIPSSATIEGIKVEIERHANDNSGTRWVKDWKVYLLKNGNVVGDNKADTSTNWPTSDAYKSYGGSSDLWGTSWTASDINNANFGVVLAVQTSTGVFPYPTAYVDHIRITVYYTPGGENNPPTINNPYPGNSSMNIEIKPACHITVSDSDGDTMTIYWYENSTGSWVLRQTNSSVSNGTYYWTFEQATSYNTTYWWKVVVNDSTDETAAIYHFTTGEEPSITINYVGNESNLGGPYYIPGLENTSGNGPYCPDGYFTDGSKQAEDWLYINCTIENSGSVSSVYLCLYNATTDTWNNDTTLINTGGDYWEVNTSGNITITAGHLYSFNIKAVDKNGDSFIVYWNKSHNDTVKYRRRYIYLGCDAIEFSYLLLNLSDYPVYPPDGVNAESFKPYDNAYHDHSAKGEATATTNDQGQMTSKCLTDYVNDNYCSIWAGFWFNETLCIEKTQLTNIYIHVWASALGNGKVNISIKKERGKNTYVGALDWKIYSPSDAKSTIHHTPAGSSGNDTFKLYADKIVLDNPLNVDDNSIYELLFIVMDVPPESDYPHVISNISFPSFIIFNVPDNDTLNNTYGDTDSDGLTDWQELYVTFTNPFITDTDHDGASDYNEYQSGTDPNNYTDRPGEKPDVQTLDAIDITNVSATLRGQIIDVGGENCDKRGFEWKTPDNVSAEDEKSVVGIAYVHGFAFYNNYLYGGSRDTTPGKVCKINASNHSDYLVKQATRGGSNVAEIHDLILESGYIYICDGDGYLVKLEPYDLDTEGYWQLFNDDVQAIASDNEYIYGAGDNGWVAKFNITSEDISSNQINVPSGEDFHTMQVDDEYIYAVTFQGYISKIWKTNLTEKSSVDMIYSGITDDSAQDEEYIYLGVESSPGKIIRVNKSDLTYESFEENGMGASYGVYIISFDNEDRLVYLDHTNNKLWIFDVPDLTLLHVVNITNLIVAEPINEMADDGEYLHIVEWRNPIRIFKLDRYLVLFAKQNWSETGTFTAGEFSHAINNLRVETTYEFRAFAHNAYGWSYGEWKNFTTITPPQLSNPSVTPLVGETSVTVFYFNISYSDEGGDPPVEIKVNITKPGWYLNASMSYVSGDNTTGALYSYSTTLKTGIYNISFYATDGTASAVNDPDIQVKSTFRMVVRADGEDYFIWVGKNCTASEAVEDIPGFDEASEYIAIWNGTTWDSENGLWIFYYGDGSGENFNIHTYDVIRIYLTDTGTVDIYATPNNYINYSATRTVLLINSTNKGANYTGYTGSTTTLSDIVDDAGLEDGEVIGYWDNSTYEWEIYVVGFSDLNVEIDKFTVVYTKVGDTRTWNIPGPEA